jgi:hypothetical protein
MTDASARALALVEELFGVPDEAANRAVDVIHAQAAAFAWVRERTGTYPTPRPIAARLDEIARRLKSGFDDRDPVPVLRQAAAEALAEYQAKAQSTTGVKCLVCSLTP